MLSEFRSLLKKIHDEPPSEPVHNLIGNLHDDVICVPVFIFTFGSSALFGRPRCGLSI